jgi:hypothetical protein
MQINGLVWDAAVSTTGDARVNGPEASRRHPLVIALAVLVFAECALLIAATIYLVIELLVASPSSLASALALTVLTAIAAVWLGVIAVNILRGSPWVRGATVVWQVLQIAVAVGSFQGLFAQPAIGWALLIPAVMVLVLVFTPPVVRATRRS